MTPDVVVDIGNSRVKWGRCWKKYDGVMGDTCTLPPDQTAWENQVAVWGLKLSGLCWVVASVQPDTLALFRAWVEASGGIVQLIDDYRLLPIRVDVDVPERVGIDRLLAAVGCRVIIPAGLPVVIINAGTAITVDLLDGSDVFRGGVILPGPRLMAVSLHQFTAQLPLLDIHDVPAGNPPGRNTHEAIAAGVMAAIKGGCQFLVDKYTAACGRHPFIVLTGGSVGDLFGYNFGPEAIPSALFEPLVLHGIRIAAEALP